MTNAYTFPASMSLATNEDGSTESRDSAVMRELQVRSNGKYIDSVWDIICIWYSK